MDEARVAWLNRGEICAHLNPPHPEEHRANDTSRRMWRPRSFETRCFASLLRMRPGNSRRAGAALFFGKARARRHFQSALPAIEGSGAPKGATHSQPRFHAAASARGRHAFRRSTCGFATARRRMAQPRSRTFRNWRGVTHIPPVPVRMAVVMPPGRSPGPPGHELARLARRRRVQPDRSGHRTRQRHISAAPLRSAPLSRRL